MKMYLNRSERCAQWIQNLTQHFDKFMFCNNLSRVNGDEASKNDATPTVRRNFRTLIDSLLIISCIAIYAFMFIKLMPEAPIISEEDENVFL